MLCQFSISSIIFCSLSAEIFIAGRLRGKRNSSFFPLHEFYTLDIYGLDILLLLQPYIVYVRAGPNPSSVDLDSVTSSHYTLLGSYLGSDEKARDAIFQSHTRHINGLAAILDDKEAAEIAKQPNAVSVFLNKGLNLRTTRSWDFLWLQRNGVIPSHSIWKHARYGEDTIIGNIDTGVWPESKSFSDKGIGLSRPSGAEFVSVVSKMEYIATSPSSFHSSLFRF